MTWQRPPTESCLSNLVLDRLLTGEPCATGAREAAQTHLDGCARCRDRLRELEADRDRFVEAAPRLSLPASPAPRRRSGAFALVGAGAGAAVVAILVVVRADLRAPAPAGPSAIRTKGGMRLSVYIKPRGEETVLAGRGGDVVHRGDAVRFAYTSPTGGYLAILGRDGSGRVSTYYPEGESAAPARAAADELLPGSIILDDVPGPEVLYGVHCQAPIEMARIVGELRAQGDAIAIAGCTFDRWILDKRP